MNISHHTEVNFSLRIQIHLLCEGLHTHWKTSGCSQVVSLETLSRSSQRPTTGSWLKRPIFLSSLWWWWRRRDFLRSQSSSLSEFKPCMRSTRKIFLPWSSRNSPPFLLYSLCCPSQGCCSQPASALVQTYLYFLLSPRAVELCLIGAPQYLCCTPDLCCASLSCFEWLSFRAFTKISIVLNTGWDKCIALTSTLRESEKEIAQKKINKIKHKKVNTVFIGL